MNEILNFKLIHIDQYTLSVWSVLVLVMIFLGTRLAIGLSSRMLMRYARRHDMDPGRRHAIHQLLAYVIWVLAVFSMLEVVGVKPTLLLASSAALLVGLGLGLQDIFADVISGIFLLVEGTIRVGHILEVDGMVGQVEEIGLRTSKFRNRDDISMIIPNRKFINEKVINWSHNQTATRFQVKVGVSYGSDVEQVRNVLLRCARDNREVISGDESRKPLVRLIDFGESSIDFELLFYSHNMFRIENTKSDLRFAIRKAFLEEKVEIPFPQRDLHLKTDVKFQEIL